MSSDIVLWILGSILILSCIGVVTLKHPVHSSLSFLLTLFSLAVLYLELSAQFIAVMQILVYAGGILVIFMFVIVLFQDAYQQISLFEGQSSPVFLSICVTLFIGALVFLGRSLIGLPHTRDQLPQNYGTVQSLGQALYVDFFFPFEAVILLFLIAVVGALYLGKKVR